MCDHIYEIEMSNGDTAETDSVAALLVAAHTMHQDAGGSTFPMTVKYHGRPALWALVAARTHVLEAV